MSARLVCMVHGSRDPSWRKPVEALVARLRQGLGDERVRLAYMELGAPTLLQVAAEAEADRATPLLVLPLFIAGGGHVLRDIPAQARAAQAAHPALSIEVLRPLGEHPDFTDLVMALGRQLLAAADRT